jgi:uncharacterized membrane protein
MRMDVRSTGGVAISTPPPRARITAPGRANGCDPDDGASRNFAAFAELFEMVQYLIAYVATAVIFLVLDFIWLSQVGRQFYTARIGDLLLDSPRIGVAAAFYLIYSAGIVVFATAPALRANAPGMAAGYGALFGLFAYATYDFTNYATLKNWSLSLSLVDLAWGTVLTGFAALAGFLVTRLIAGA